LAQNFISFQGSVNNLGDASLVGDSGDQSVFRGVIFIFILDD